MGRKHSHPREHAEAEAGRGRLRVRDFRSAPLDVVGVHRDPESGKPCLGRRSPTRAHGTRSHSTPWTPFEERVSRWDENLPGLRGVHRRFYQLVKLYMKCIDVTSAAIMLA